MAGDFGNVGGGGVFCRGRGVEAVDIGEQDQAIGLDHGGDAGRKAVIVAIADFGGGDAVVLVDDGDGAQAEQGGDGGARVEVVAALLGDIGGDQDLAGDDRVAAERLGPGLAQRDLAGAGGGLGLLQGEGDGVELEQETAQSDGAGGDDDDLGASGFEGRDVFGEVGEPGRAEFSGRAIDEEGGADFDGQAAVGGEGVHGATNAICTLPLAGRVGEGDESHDVRLRDWGSEHPLPTSPVKGEVPLRVCCSMKGITAPNWVPLCGGPPPAWRLW